MQWPRTAPTSPALRSGAKVSPALQIGREICPAHPPCPPPSLLSSVTLPACLCCVTLMVAF